MKEVDINSWNDTILNNPKTVLVDFYAEWCKPCEMIKPLLEQIDKEYTEVEICKLNVDNYPQLASKYAIKSIPAIISFKNGQVYRQLVGVQPKENIIALFK